MQLYFRDMVGSVTRPVRELLRFQRVTLDPGASESLTFVFSTDDLAFYGSNKEWITELGSFKIWVAKHALDTSNELDFTLN